MYDRGSATFICCCLGRVATASDRDLTMVICSCVPIYMRDHILELSLAISTRVHASSIHRQRSVGCLYGIESRDTGMTRYLGMQKGISPLLQKFSAFAYGYLYATLASSRRPVPVPYNYGVTKIESADDLFINAWVPYMSSTYHIVDRSVGCIRVTHFPGTGLPLEFAYTIFLRPPSCARVACSQSVFLFARHQAVVRKRPCG
jgi:hypothetical protein